VLALSLAGGHARKALTGEEIYPFRDLGYRDIGEEESCSVPKAKPRYRSCYMQKNCKYVL
jgi:hypothetical protein